MVAGLLIIVLTAATFLLAALTTAVWRGRLRLSADRRAIAVVTLGVATCLAAWWLGRVLINVIFHGL
jgi:hypothetical protein